MPWNKCDYYLQKCISNDDLMIKSIFMLPSSVVEFSKIDLPTINIMTRSSWNQNYLSLSQVFSKNNIKSIETKKINTFDETNFDYNRLQSLCPSERPRKWKNVKKYQSLLEFDLDIEERLLCIVEMMYGKKNLDNYKEMGVTYVTENDEILKFKMSQREKVRMYALKKDHEYRELLKAKLLIVC